ncbi:transposase family protein [Streptomyces sp. NPDC057521]|uniref:transposase family protein n=1 Tax=Streptomyces sp. NPDC057521 TaxID=3346156 RepID=UPI0036BD1273
MLAYPSGIDLSSRALQHLADILTGHRRRIGFRWCRLTCGRQALLVLAHLRCGDTYARLAAGCRASGALPGAVHNLTAARTHGIPAALAAGDIKCWADKAYQGAGPAVRVPFRGKTLRGWRQRHNRDHAKIRSLGERATATLKCWRLLRKLHCNTNRTTAVVRVILALELAT